VAPEAIFESTVDLSGTRIKKSLDMRGVRFERPAIFDVAPAPARFPARFDESADFSLAIFEDVATFHGAHFGGTADFDLARFRADAIFDGTSFAGAAAFTSAHFDGGASFATADTVFAGETAFDFASFALGADFTQAEFDADAHFYAARFANDARFVGSDFTSVSFDNVQAAKALDLTGVAASSLALSRTTAQSVTLRDVTLDSGGLAIDQLATPDLDLAVSDVSYVQGGSQAKDATLKLIEESAKNRGDLSVANDAHFQQQLIASNSQPPLRRALDAFFYRWIAGYLVRPWHPIITLLILGFAVFLVRVIWRTTHAVAASTAFQEGKASLPRRPWRRVVLGGNALLDTAAAILPGRANPGAGEGTEFLRRVERFVFRALVVCVLIGLANSNPTLRQVLDALL
jgi:hypothetical protein